MESEEKEKIKCDMFRAYYDARKNKRYIFSGLTFDKKYESNLLQSRP
jgi:hypothetical protein